jgi:hypothetical protein
MIWAIAVLSLGVASIWLGLYSIESYRQVFRSDPRSVIGWEVIAAAIFHGDGSSTYGPKLILLGLVFVLLGTAFLIAKLVELLL